jgi:hypothetical protein
MKNLLVGGMLTLALLLSAGTASAQNSPTPGGTDSNNADDDVTQIFALAQLALEFASAGDDPVVVELAFDLFVVSYYAFVSVDGYNNGYFSICSVVGFPDDLTGDAEAGGAILQIVQTLASTLATTGNPFAPQIVFFAALGQNDLTLALQNGD